MSQKESSQNKILSDMHWDEVMKILEFIFNDIYPSDFRKFSPDGKVSIYFKNKYLIIRNDNRNKN